MAKLGLSPRQFAQAVGIPVYRVRRMVEAGTLAADRSTRRITIPRSEVARLAGPELGLDLATLQAELAREVRAAVREEFAAMARRMTGGAA